MIILVPLNLYKTRYNISRVGATYINAKNKEKNFPPLQKRIILHLAQSRPQTVNETMKGISGHYKSTWIAFKALKKKGLIKHTTSKDYKNRQYACYWLTELGVFIALYERAKQEVLLQTTREIYPEDKDLQFLIEGVPILGQYALEVLYLAALNRGEINPTDLIAIFAAQLQNKFTPKQRAEFITVLRKYPQQHRKTYDELKRITDQL